MPAPSSRDTLVATERGTMCFNAFAFGVDLDGKYTAAEIFDTAVKNKPSEIEVNHPTVSNYIEYNKYVWTPWTRFSRFSGERMLRRCKFSTAPNQSDEIVQNYIGTNESVDYAWMRYITTSDRLGVLSKFGSSLRGMRILDLGCGSGNNLLALSAYGVDAYGVDSHPEMYNRRHNMLGDRVIFGDALECLYAFKASSFDGVFVSMLGSVWWADIGEFFPDLAKLVRLGGIVVLDVIPHKHATLRSNKMYKEAMSEAGFPLKLKTDNMLVGVRTK